MPEESNLVNEPTAVTSDEPDKTHWKRPFFTIFAGQTISLIGSAAVQFSLIWWLASKSDSPMVMALAGLCAFIPQLVLGPFAGVWIDRLHRKYVMIAADMFIGLFALILAIVFWSGTPAYWLVGAVLGVRAIGNVFHTPATQAVIPMLVPQDELVRANGLSQFVQSGAFMLGPVLGAAMYAVLPMPIILLTDLLGAIVACTAVALVKIPDPPRQVEKNHFFHELKEGALVLIRDRKLLIVTIAFVLVMIFMMPMSSFYPLYTSSYFSLSAWHGSIVELVYAAGLMVAAAVMSAFGNIRRKFLLIHIGIFMFAFTALLAGLLPPTFFFFWVFVAICFVMGASNNILNIPYMAYMQETLPPEAMGRAFSLVGSLMSLSMPLGLLFAGPIAESKGVPFWFLLGGAASIVITLISALLIKRQNNKNYRGSDSAPTKAAP